MKKITALLCAFIGLAAASHAQTTITDSILVDGIYRSFIFRTPASFTQAHRPLVINMHGLGSNAMEQEYYGYFDPIADTAGFYLVMPQGTSIAGTTFWSVGFPGTAGVDDIKFISTLIDTLRARYPIDATQVYATGMSNGGYMSHLLALQLSNKIAAVGSVAGSIVSDKYAAVAAQRAIPVMEIHGDADGTVPYEGFAYGIPIDTLMGAWVRWNGCNTTPVKTSIPNTNTADGCTADKYVWSGGAADVVLFHINGGGHTWPGALFNIGVTNQDMNASLEIWRFFRKYRLSTTTSVGSAMQTVQPGWLSPNPATSVIRITAAGNGVTTLTDLSGRVLLQTKGKELNLRSIPAGSYQVQFRSASGTQTTSIIKE